MPRFDKLADDDYYIHRRTRGQPAGLLPTFKGDIFDPLIDEVEEEMRERQSQVKWSHLTKKEGEK